MHCCCSVRRPIVHRTVSKPYIRVRRIAGDADFTGKFISVNLSVHKLYVNVREIYPDADPWFFFFYTLRNPLEREFYNPNTTAEA